jgi:fibronectin-binding autotransporter adhesin
MKPRHFAFLPTACCLVLTAVQSHAASGSWTTATDGDWSDSGKWTGGVPNAAGETATFNQDWTGQTVTVVGNFTVGSILASDSTGGGGLLLSGGTLTLDNGASKPVIQTSAGFTEPGGSAPFNNPLRITSVLAGSNGFEKTGPGYLSLEAANTFTGNIKLTAPASGGGSFLRLTNDNNLGAAGNDIEVVANAQAVGLFASTGFDVTLNANRNIITSSTSGTQDFWVKTKGTGNITIGGVISGDTRFRKNDSGIATLTGSNTYTGGTFIEGGTLVLSGGNNRLLSGSTVSFGNNNSTLDLTSTSQTLNALVLSQTTSSNIKGAGGTLILQGSGDYTVNRTATGTSLDMSGLSNFTFNRSSQPFQLNANGENVVNTINLAKAGTNTINAAFVRFGGGANFAGQNVLIGLGQENKINATNEFVIGYFQGNGDVFFQSGLTAPSLTVRGENGGSNPVPLMTVGSTNSGNRSSVGILNLTGGSLDVIATEMNVARHFANASVTSSTGTVTMPDGTVVATTLNIASKANTTTGAPTLTGTFNQSGGAVTATTLNLGNNTNAEAPNLIANYNLSGGTLYAASITGSGATYGASTVRTLTLDGGTLRNIAGSDLGVNGVANTATGRINLNVNTASAIHADAAQSITLGANTALAGSANLTKSGQGSLVINATASTYTGTLSVNAGTLGGATTLGGAIILGSAGTLAPGNSIGTIGAQGLTWDGGGVMSFELSNTGATSDLLSLTGAFSKGAAGTWVFDFNGSGLLNQTYTLVTFGSTDFNFSNFSYINLGSNYTGNFGMSGSALSFTVVPEPSTALIGLLLATGLLRRRRQGHDARATAGHESAS